MFGSLLNTGQGKKVVAHGDVWILISYAYDGLYYAYKANQKFPVDVKLIEVSEEERNRLWQEDYMRRHKKDDSNG